MSAPSLCKPYRRIIAHYEECLARFGDTPQGVDWPNSRDAQTRYSVMTEVIRPEDRGKKVSLLDFGCGASHLYEYLQAHGLGHIAYAGLDLSEQFIRLSRSKFPHLTFYQLDLLGRQAEQLPDFDYIILNGVLTEKQNLTFDEMWDYARELLSAVFRRARCGIAFNVMSKQVDWERDDLFHLPMDLLAGFLTRELSRHFIFRSDYGLYEYTTCLYRAPASR